MVSNQENCKKKVTKELGSKWYRTLYTLKILDKDGNTWAEISNSSDLKHIVQNHNMYESKRFLKLISDLLFSDEPLYTGILHASSSSWQEYYEEMLELSCKYHDFILYLYGEGEGQGDLWKMYFYKGYSKSIIPEIVFPELNIEEFVNNIDNPT
jgi:hypothetical protein